MPSTEFQRNLQVGDVVECPFPGRDGILGVVVGAYGDRYIWLALDPAKRSARAFGLWISRAGELRLSLMTPELRARAIYALRTVGGHDDALVQQALDLLRGKPEESAPLRVAGRCGCGECQDCARSRKEAFAILDSIPTPSGIPDRAWTAWKRATYEYYRPGLAPPDAAGRVCAVAETAPMAGLRAAIRAVTTPSPIRVELELEGDD